MNTEFPDKEKNLDILQEECAEVIQAISKIKRFGINSHNPDSAFQTTNIEKLVNEIGHVVKSLEIVCKDYGITMSQVLYSSASKGERIKKYYNTNKI
jgi:NTP pyrophosphatase (non-canonical NTP hydrolase)